MNFSLELFIGLRYLRAKKRNHFISFISSISIFGIALAIILLITVLSVMNGFQQELRDRILVMTSHVTVSAANGSLQDWQLVTKALAEDIEITGSAPYVEMFRGTLHPGFIYNLLLNVVASFRPKTKKEPVERRVA